MLPPSFLPDLVSGKLFSSFLSIPISNFHSSEWLKILKVSVIKQSWGMPLVLKLSSLDQRIPIAPGQVRPVKVELGYRNENDKKDSLHQDVVCSDLNLVLRITTNRGQDHKLPLTLRCREQRESFLFTFLDHDGSVQHGAAITPLATCTSGSCPVLLTLHGTSKNSLLYSNCGLST